MAKCKRCGKPLRNKQSIARGYGPGCYKKVSAETKNDYEPIEERIEIEGQIDVQDLGGIANG